MKIPCVVVIAPTLNEQATIKAFLTQILRVIKKNKKYHWSVVVVDSHSTDKTPKIVLALKKKYPRKLFLLSAPKGLGKSLYAALEFSYTELKADFAITLEADLSNDPKQLPEFVAHLSDNDLVVGSRYMAGGRIEHWSFARKLLSRSANLALRVLVGSTVHEYTNLYRSLRMSRWPRLRRELKGVDGWLFVPALAFEAIKLRLRIHEIPIIYADRRGGKSKMDTPSYTKNLLFYALRFRMNRHGTFS